MLERLGHTPGDGAFIGIGIRPQGRPFQTMVGGAEWRTPRCRVSRLLRSPAQRRLFLDQRRGPHGCRRARSERDVTRWNALYGDFDVKPGAFTNIDDALACIATISAMLGTRPSVLIFSGHGVQPLWPIEDGLLDTEAKWEAAARLSRRIGRLMATVAWRDHHAGMDSVFDLSRMLRVPDTFNLKDPRHIVMAYALADTGGPLTVERIEEALDEWGETLGVPELDSDRPVRGEVISPPQGWRFAACHCRYTQRWWRCTNLMSVTRRPPGRGCAPCCIRCSINPMLIRCC